MLITGSQDLPPMFDYKRLPQVEDNFQHLITPQMVFLVQVVCTYLGVRFLEAIKQIPGPTDFYANSSVQTFLMHIATIVACFLSY